VGITLVARDRKQMTLRDPAGGLHVYRILAVFPFTSESKRMGIIVRGAATGEITFVQKGADVVMSKIVQKNDWLDEECGNMAREGLRTLVIGRKRLSEEAYKRFDQHYKEAQVNTSDRNNALSHVIAAELELELDLLALTGVEDKLQEDVKPTLEVLRNAGLKIWMLTGDKIETATCIAMSSKLVARGQYIHQVAKCSYPRSSMKRQRMLTRCFTTSETVKTNQQVLDMLDFVRTKLECCLVIDGESLQVSSSMASTFGATS
jgi:phospholipid-translocating ATPase